eukprot:9491038-Pyramimonas_sp.AAC.1
MVCPPPITPSPGPERGGSQVVGASNIAQDGPQTASISPRLLPRWPKMAPYASIVFPLPLRRASHPCFL